MRSDTRLAPVSRSWTPASADRSIGCQREWYERDEEAENEAQGAPAHAHCRVGAIRWRRRFKAWDRIWETRDSVTWRTSAICRRFSSS